MTASLLLDTHIALWLENGDERLRPVTLALIEQCWRDGGTILLSAISVWEIAQLIHAGRIMLDRPLKNWVAQFIDRPGVDIVSLSHGAAMGAYQLQDLDHRDPADRLLIASAIERICPLVTYDERIIRFSALYGVRYAFKTES